MRSANVLRARRRLTTRGQHLVAPAYSYWPGAQLLEPAFVRAGVRGFSLVELAAKSVNLAETVERRALRRSRSQQRAGTCASRAASSHLPRNCKTSAR
jgi:hypothetical protein